MAKFSLRRVDIQAQVGAIASGLSVFSFLGLAGVMYYLLKRGLQSNDFVFIYGPNGKIAVYLGGAITLGLAAIGFGMGLSSAGQRRNEKQRLSWIGFFLGAAVLALTFVALFVFMQRGEQIIQ